MKKKVIITVTFTIALVIIVLAVAGGIILYNKNLEEGNVDNNKAETTNEVATEEQENDSFLEDYEKYIKENIFEKQDITNMDVAFINIENDEEAIPILAYKIENRLAFLSLDGDMVNESKYYSDANIRVFYSVEDKELNYFVEKDGDYISLPDIVSQKSKPETIEVDDETLEYTYIDTETKIAMKEIESETITEDLKSAYENYKNTIILTEEKQKELGEEIQKINDNTLKQTADGISNAQYTIAYGSYVCGEDTFTINADNSSRYVHDSPGTGYDIDSSYKLEYDTINFDNDNKEFKIIGNNQIEQEETNQIYNLK